MVFTQNHQEGTWPKVSSMDLTGFDGLKMRQSKIFSPELNHTYSKRQRIEGPLKILKCVRMFHQLRICCWSTFEVLSWPAGRCLWASPLSLQAHIFLSSCIVPFCHCVSFFSFVRIAMTSDVILFAVVCLRPTGTHPSCHLHFLLVIFR